MKGVPALRSLEPMHGLLIYAVSFPSGRPKFAEIESDAQSILHLGAFSSD